MSRILLLGAGGQIGAELRAILCTGHEVSSPDSSSVNLQSAEQIARAVRETSPNLIINAAAYTAVDRAEDDPEQAAAVNAAAPGILAREAVRAGAALIHYSTDYVFDGHGTGAYREDDPARPLNVYGDTKLQGERAIAASGGAAVIFRTSWVYGLRGHNFLLSMQRLLREREQVSVVDDQIGAPTWSRAIARATVAVISRSDADACAYFSKHRGIYHMTAQGHTSWHGFAAEIRDALSARGVATARLRPIPSTDYPTAARRPANSVLDNARLRTTFGVELPDWRASLRECLSGQNP